VGCMGDAEAGGGGEGKDVCLWSCHLGRLSIGLSGGINHDALDTAAPAVHLLDYCANAMAAAAAEAAAAAAAAAAALSHLCFLPCCRILISIVRHFD
jgi:hypothetical protein